MSGSRTGRQVKPAIRDSSVMPRGLTDPSQELQRLGVNPTAQRKTNLPHGGTSEITSGRTNTKK